MSESRFVLKSKMIYRNLLIPELNGMSIVSVNHALHEINWLFVLHVIHIISVFYKTIIFLFSKQKGKKN